MKLSISNIAWSSEHDAEMYDYMHLNGFSGLEIAPTRIFTEAPYRHLEEARTWAENLRKTYQLEISSMQSIWYGHTEKIFASDSERQILIDYTKQAIDFAEIIGCHNLVFGNPKNRDTSDIKAALPIAIKFFHEIGEYAAKHHTIIAIEPNPTIYNTRFLNSTKDTVAFVQEVACPGIMVNIDLGTILQNGEELEYLPSICQFINHIHISEPYLNLIEQRELHHRLFEIVTEINYNKYVSIEMGNHGDIDKVKSTISYICQIFHIE